MTDIFKMEIHKAANIFPMLPDDELDELAADIKANGLINPIIVKGNILIDGRNRREACKRAGIDPEVQELNGADPEAFIISSNINRRHMTKGQRAMAVAMIYPDPAKLKRKFRDETSNEFSRVALSKARTVLKHLPSIAGNVLNQSISLDDAYKQAKAVKDESQSESARLEQLRELSPELAGKVTDGELTLNGAIAEHQQRETDARINRQGIWDMLATFENYSHGLSAGKNEDSIINAIRNHGDECKVDVRALFSRLITDLTRMENKL